jgi:hypothetical protein
MLASAMVLFLSFCYSCAAENNTSIESAFQSYFGEPMKLVTGDKEVKILVDPIEEDSASITVKMAFDLQAWDKALLVKLKNTGYTTTGYFNSACAEEPVFIAAFTFPANQTITELETRMRTQCSNDAVTLLLWAKNREGKYYSNSVTFQTTTESP